MAPMEELNSENALSCKPFGELTVQTNMRTYFTFLDGIGMLHKNAIGKQPVILTCRFCETAT